MKILLFILYFLIGVLLILLIWSKFYDNPYKCVIFIGRKGSGKTSISVKIAQTFIKFGWSVFSDSPIFDCYKLDVNWLGRYDFPERSLLIVDEGAIAFDNRKFASFSDEMRNFFTLQRHKKIYCIILSQSFNVDKKIRDLTDSIYVVVNYFNVFSIAKRVHKGIGLSQDADGCGSIAETYSWDLPFSWKFIFIPRWIKFFDSFIAPEYPKVKQVKHAFEDSDNIIKYRSWRYYKIQQLLGMLRFVNVRIPRSFIITEKQYKQIFVPGT